MGLRPLVKLQAFGSQMAPVASQAILAGAVSDWNKENPAKAVQPGDRAESLRPKRCLWEGWAASSP